MEIAHLLDQHFHSRNPLPCFEYFVLCTVLMFTYVAMLGAIIVHNSHIISRGSREFSKFCLEKNARDLCKNVGQLN